MRTIRIKAYKFDELSAKAKEKAIEWAYYLNVDYDWWTFTYEDADRIGLKINEFDIDRQNYCKAEFISGPEECAYLIEKEHGENCGTYNAAKDYLAARDVVIDGAARDENGDFEDEYEVNENLDKLDREFLKILQAEYLSSLRSEYEYLTSEESIIEIIRSNEYEFTAEGKRI